MSKATGRLRGLLGGRKKTGSVGKEKKGWGFVRSLRDGGDGKADRKKVSSYRESQDPPRCNACGSDGGPGAGRAVAGDDEEQSKRAIAVAAATAAVAEAAVAAAQAAAAVVRLTTGGPARGAVPWRREDWAAVKIQSAFRGYLARRALKALKGLVKIQALVRGHIVRKQAAETLRCMHALVRAQARARAGRLIDNRLGNKGSRRRSLEPLPPERNGVRPTSSKGNASRVKNTGAICPTEQHSSSLNWLDHWMEERYWDSRESMSRNSKTTDDDKDEKILEIDAGRPRTNPRWRNIHHSMCYDPTSRSFTAMPSSPLKDSMVVQHSMPSPSSVEMQPPLSSLMFPLEGGECTESPMFHSASSCHGSSKRGPFTPLKSECSRSFFGGYSDYPNYMANTESSRAKARSQSTPRQRPEFEKSSNLSQVESRGGGPGSSSQRSLHLKLAGKAYPGSGRLDRMGMPVRM